jgi:hypothetical protein
MKAKSSKSRSGKEAADQSNKLNNFKLTIVSYREALGKASSWI